MVRYKVPSYAKKKASAALKKREMLPESKRFGITKQQAKKLKINSGVERAKQIKRSKTVPEKDAKRIAAFYQRFKNCKTPKCEGAIDLWGGRRWGRELSSELKKKNG